MVSIVMMWFLVKKLQIFEIYLYFCHFLPKNADVWCWCWWVPSFGISFSFLTSLLTILRGAGHLDPPSRPILKNPVWIGLKDQTHLQNYPNWDQERRKYTLILIVPNKIKMFLTLAQMMIITPHEKFRQIVKFLFNFQTRFWNFFR